MTTSFSFSDAAAATAAAVFGSAAVESIVDEGDSIVLL
tara:strand:- start:211 stop:324 length:114 start_codon:yes stop_codon:yes gene_type:complete